MTKEKPATEEPEQQKNSCFENFAICFFILLVIITIPFSMLVCLRVVYEYQRAVIFRYGRLKEDGVLGPGLFFILPCIDDFFIIELRTETIDVYPQDILTKDAVTIKLDGVVFFRVYNPTLAVLNIGNYRYSTMLLAQTTLRNVAGTKKLTELLTERDEISLMLRNILDEATVDWGIKVERVEIKDVRLPPELQRSMAAEAEANREARAKIIAAEGEKSAAVSLKIASDILSASPAAVQMRYLQTLHAISSENNSTIVIPFPKEIAKYFFNFIGSSYMCTCGLDTNLTS